MFSQYSTKCGKMRYLSATDAETRITEREAELNNGWRGRTYQCPQCQFWHISTVDKNKLKKQAEEAKQREAKKVRMAEIAEEKRKAEIQQKKLEKIKQDSAQLRKMAKKNNQGTTKTNKKNNPSDKWRNNTLKDDGSSVVESFGNASKNSVFSNLDPEIVEKLKKKI